MLTESWKPAKPVENWWSSWNERSPNRGLFGMSGARTARPDVRDFAQVEHPDWCVIHDMDCSHVERTRRQLLDRIEAEGLILSANHFPEPGFGRVVRLDGRRVWQAQLR